ncbi:uncharacterized protein LOC141638655 isoform X2 [Silene latifolia]|uniref:uncharacterized protein LOC141638655 isoform X2 n=1 Tax=Silene latifolia TaxID=37657 RepID=UPI003D7891CF
MTVYDSFTAWINSFLACIGSCLGRGAKPAGAPPNNDDRSKELYSQGQVVEKHSFSEDFWGTSAGDLDYVFGVSQRSISSLSTSNLSFHSDLIAASTNSNNEFVNHGLRLWNQNRLQWIGGTKTSNEAHQAQGHTISMLSSKERFRKSHPIVGNGGIFS